MSGVALLDLASHTLDHYYHTHIPLTGTYTLARLSLAMLCALV